jgi:hypothetical protein
VADRGSSQAGPRPTPGRALWRAPLPIHLLLLLIALAAMAALLSAPDSFATDEGSYEIQLRALDRGDWVWPSGTEDLDPDDSHYPVAYAEQGDDGWVPLAKHPLWPLVGLAASRVVGLEHAFAVLGGAAVLVAATMAWFVGADHGRRQARLAFWLAGLAPMAVTAGFGWAHAAAAAVAGIALLGLVRLCGPPGRREMLTGAALLAVGLILGILLRSEGILFAAAAAVALVVGSRTAGRRWRWALPAGLAVLALTAAVVLVEAWWVDQILRSPNGALSARTGGGVVPSSFLDGRYEGATRSLLDPRGGALSLVLLATIVATAAVAVLAARGRREAARAWPGVLALAVALVALRLLSQPTEPIPGLVLAWPVLLVGVAAIGDRWRQLTAELTLAVVFGGAIVATQYPDGGAVQWGGRFFAPLTVPLAVVAAVGLARLLAATERLAPERAVAAKVIVVAAIALPTLLGVRLAGEIRTFHTETYEAVAERVEGVAITPDPQLPRMMWRYELPWLVVEETDGGADLTALLDHLADEPQAPDELSLVLRAYDLPQADRALEAVPAWAETGRHERNGLTVVTLAR